MRSMTGYGKAECTEDGRMLSIEMKTVNNRFLDISLKAPRLFAFAEDSLRREIQSIVKRGRIDVLLTYSDCGEAERNVEIDLPLARGYIEAAKKLRVAFGLADDFQLTALMKTPDVVKPQAAADDEAVLGKLLMQCAKKALKNLDVMREREGMELLKDIGSHLEIVIRLVSEIKSYSPEVTAEYRSKLSERMREILAGVEVDETRLLNEAAFFADKCNVDEEISRLCSHTEQILELLKSAEPVGRKLDFIVQELNREANTICSKANHIKITNLGLELKGEIEKIREQVQNIE